MIFQTRRRPQGKINKNTTALFQLLGRSDGWSQGRSDGGTVGRADVATIRQSDGRIPITYCAFCLISLVEHSVWNILASWIRATRCVNFAYQSYYGTVSCL